MIIKVNKRFLLIDIMFISICILELFFLDDSPNNLPCVGLAIVGLSIYMLFKARNNRLLLYLFMVIMLVNISIGINDFIQMGEGISEWQSIGLRNTCYNMQAAKAMLLFWTIVNCFVNYSVCSNCEGLKNIEEMRHTNKYIAYGCFIVLIIILAYAVVVEVPQHLGGAYESIENPLYEYSVLLFVISWMYSKNIRLLNRFYIIYCIFFAATFMLMGDRSSISMYILFYLVTHYKGKLNFNRIVVFGGAGVILMNMLSVFRSNGLLALKEMISLLIKQGFYIDTGSWAYYGGLSMIGVSNAIDKRGVLFWSFIKSLFGINDEYSNLTLYARNYSDRFYNADGGIFPTYMLAISGYIGVVISAIIVGIIIKKLFVEVKGVKLYFKFLTIIFCIRWYVYTPLNLFRSVFIVGGVAYLFCFYIGKLSLKER